MWRDVGQASVLVRLPDPFVGLGDQIFQPCRHRREVDLDQHAPPDAAAITLGRGGRGAQGHPAHDTGIIAHAPGPPPWLTLRDRIAEAVGKAGTVLWQDMAGQVESPLSGFPAKRRGVTDRGYRWKDGNILTFLNFPAVGNCHPIASANNHLEQDRR